MSPHLVRIIVGILFLGHGLGHAMPALPLLGFRLSASHSSKSWLLNGFAGAGAASAICVAMNLLALLAFMGAGLSVAEWGVPREAWGRLATAGAFVSLLALVLFWDAYPFLFPNKVGVILVDLFAIVTVLFARWPAALFHE